MPLLISLQGKRFGRLVVVRRASRMGRHAGWLCRCDCGVTRAVRGDSLRDGAANSCGCWKRDRLVTVMTTHGGAKRRGTTYRDRLYSTWLGMIQRCEYKANASYKYYGARGITVCRRWRKSFAAFRADVGSKPTAAHSLERIDNNRGYTRANVRWATMREQARNRRAWGRA